MKVLYQQVQGFLVESNLAIGLVICVQKDSSGRKVEGNLHSGQFILDNDVFNHMLMQVLIKDRHVHLMGSQHILPS